MNRKTNDEAIARELAHSLTSQFTPATIRKSNPLEKDIEAKVVAYARSLNVLCYKFTSPSRRSVPDRLFIGPKGQVWFIEFKRYGQNPTPAQGVEIAKIEAQKVPVWVVDNVAQGKRVVDHMLTNFYTQRDF